MIFYKYGKKIYPFLISVPHGGTAVPESVRPLLQMGDEDLRYYCDPFTRIVFGYKNRVAAYIDSPVSRMVVDLNHPPLPLPLRDPDGIIKVKTVDGREVTGPGRCRICATSVACLRNIIFPITSASMSSSTTNLSGSHLTATPWSPTVRKTRRMSGNTL
jgi:N-formylglutamate amidohydrolase